MFQILQENERTGKPKHIGYGGARGGGKSWTGRFFVDYMCGKYAGIKGLVLRTTMPELQQNYITPLETQLKGRAEFKQKDNTFYFTNGSMLICGYCEIEKHVKRYQGNEYDFIIFEEATNFQEEWMKLIGASCRGVNNFPKFVLYTMNPGGVSHNYIKRIFIDRVYRSGEEPDNYAFVQAKATDNTVLMATQPDYIKFLDSLSAKYQKAWRDGDWNIFDGMFFEDFINDPTHYEDRRFTHVIPAFEPSKRWTYLRGFDWGYAKPFSVGWYAIDFRGTMYRILEFYGCQYENGEALPNTGLKWPSQTVFKKIHQIETEHPWLRGVRIEGIADPAIWQEDGGVSIAETAAQNQVFFSKGDHARIPGWQMCHNYLQFDTDGYPRFYVFDTCRDFIRTIPTLIHDEHNPEDMETKISEDHAADEWRYICMSRPVAPLEPEEQYRPMYGMDPLNQFTR